MVPFLPCCVKREATLLAPLANIRPGILCACCGTSDSPCFVLPLPNLLGFLDPGDSSGDDGEEQAVLRPIPTPPPLPSEDRQDPILRALITLNRHSRPDTHPNSPVHRLPTPTPPLIPREGSVDDALQDSFLLYFDPNFPFSHFFLTVRVLEKKFAKMSVFGDPPHSMT